ncbi:MAG TPA: metallophosphoesterase [Bryobacteraceae bacterium]|nr:metallophosphoesterase [Bryobacteraceae bacterium]
MGVRPHYLPELIVWLLCLGAICFLYRWAREEHGLRRQGAIGILALSVVWITAGLAFSIYRIVALFPEPLTAWVRGLSIGVAICLLWAFWVLLIIRLFRSRKPPVFSPQRRDLMRAATILAVGAPVAVTTFAIIKRNNLSLKEFTIALPDLHPDLNGLKLVQISDIHLSPFVPEAVLARAIDMANETRAHIGLITGDLISRSRDPLDACFRQLKRLRVDSEMLGCLGNHEVYSQTEDYTTEQGARQGISFLRMQARMLRFGGARLNFAGVDYQPRNQPYLEGAEDLIVPGVTNILLSHNPDVFPVAGRQGYDLTIAGHTHGGQINVEILHNNMSPVRFLTPYVYGLYREGRSSVFVTRGIGTVGIPARFGAPPEVALIRLCAT